MQMTVEQRLQVLEDVQEIAHLKASYCNAADCGWNRTSNDADTIASLFVAEGVWDAGAFGLAEGREAILQKFKADLYPFGFHRISNPIIKVNGNTATGEWHFLVPCILNINGNQSMWIGGIYNDEFVRTSEGWKFLKLKVTPAFTSMHVQGWDVAGLETT